MNGVSRICVGWRILNLLVLNCVHHMGGYSGPSNLFYVEMCLFVESVLSCVENCALPHVEKGVSGGCCTTGEVLYSGLLSAGK